MEERKGDILLGFCIILMSKKTKLTFNGVSSVNFEFSVSFLMEACKISKKQNMCCKAVCLCFKQFKPKFTMQL